MKTLKLAIGNTVRCIKLHQHTLFLLRDGIQFAYNRLKGQIKIYVHITHASMAVWTRMWDLISREHNIIKTQTHSPGHQHIFLWSHCIQANIHVPTGTSLEETTCVYPYTSQRCELNSSTHKALLTSDPFPSNRWWVAITSGRLSSSKNSSRENETGICLVHQLYHLHCNHKESKSVKLHQSLPKPSLYPPRKFTTLINGNQVAGQVYNRH